MPCRAPTQVYADACGVIGALAEKLRASGGPYLLGALPSSLDALVVGHLLFYRHSPAAAPVLQEQVRAGYRCRCMRGACVPGTPGRDGASVRPPTRA